MQPFTFLALLVYANSALAAVIFPNITDIRDVPYTPISPRDATALSADAFAAIIPFANFACAAYCPSDTVATWECGAPCSALPGFEVTLTGGDGAGTQLFYVGYWPEKSAVVVAHQGTDPKKLIADLTDLNLFMQGFNNTLFPGMTSGAEGHGGFLEQYSSTTSTISSEVNRLISSKGATSVIATGHSLGGALAELDSLSYSLTLPSSIQVKGVTFGTPRVGNGQYAAFFDSHVSDFQRINNMKDPVPIIPGRFLGFSHVRGEIHIVDAESAVACSGDDDDFDDSCTIKTVPNIFESAVGDHSGPYNGVMIGSSCCV
ncbi:alpha/beta-hydrolase [Irpex rosettiformis]|uniref:Alpha/beta-hydrolase n=1 Tax=Irpex rosettiformis TaxID=378272 RepID=A0ACB8TWV9_9APHY|nr:alpha/beta-hydrolase [Irpex rosettiformis]